MISKVDDISVLGPTGEIDHHEGRLVLDSIKNLLQFDWKKIVLDLGEVSHIHYRFLADLLPLAAASHSTAGGIKLANPTPYTRDILKVTGADRFFETYDTVAEAILSFENVSSLPCRVQ